MTSSTELLQLLGDAPDNEMNLGLLAEQMETGTGVVPFIGAGLSVPFGFPPWSAFLLSLADRAALTAPIQRRLDAGEFEEAADDLSDALGARRFQDLVEHSYGDRQLRDAALTGAIALVPRIAVGPVITTNFDHVLERVFAAGERHFDHVVTGARADMAIKGFHQNRAVLLKIHGDVDDSSRRILTLDEYREHYGNTTPTNIDTSRPLVKLLQLMMSARPFLFIGCSLGPDRTVAILKAVARDLSAVAHYAVVERPADDAAFRTKDRELSDQAIRPIWYPHARHDLIEPILEHLAGRVPAHQRRRAGDGDAREPTLADHNLPTAVSKFVGREADIETVSQLLGEHRLVTLVGAGGCGKTRLALEAARAQLATFADGVWLVELASVHDAAHVPQRIASALKMQEQAREPPTEVLASYLAGRTALLVLDNCEHVVAACAALVAELLARCPALKILATSRQVLNAPGESLLRVSPLHVPDAGGPRGPEALQRFEAVQLFVDRARSHQRDFAVTDDNAMAVGAICRRLDGIPLAIELAAARLSLLSVFQINERLDDAFALLSGGSPAALEQHQTLEATMDWSYGLLTETQQATLRALSVFAGGWTFEAAHFVTAGDPDDDIGVLDQLGELVNRSLVVAERDGDARRFHQLETIDQYATAKLEAAGEARIMRGRHAEWFLDLAERADPELLTAKQSAWLGKLELEHDNILDAIRWCVDAGDVVRALRFGAATWRFWEIRGYLIMGRDQLATLLALPADEDETLRAKTLSGAGMLAYRQGDAQAARQHFEGALAIERRHQNAGGIANALNDLGIVAQAQGEFELARESYTESYELERAAGNERGMAVALFNMGNTAYFLGELDTADETLERSLATFESTDNMRESAFPLTALGMVALLRNDADLARSRFQESYDRRAELGDKRGMGDSLNGLGRAALLDRQLRECHTLLTDALTVRREVGDRKGIAASIESFALLAEEDGEFSRVPTLLGAAATLRDSIGTPLPPVEREELDRCAAIVRETIGEVAYERAWAKGQALSLDDAVSEVLWPTRGTGRKSREIRSSHEVMKKRVSQEFRVWKPS